MNAVEFKQLFLSSHTKMYAIAFRMMGNAQDAEDMVQNAYMKLWSRRDTLGCVQDIPTYCASLMRNMCIDVFRRRHFDEKGCATGMLMLAADTNTALEVECRDEARIVEKIIERLSDGQRQVLVLRDVDGMSFEEIERATGLGFSNIRVLLSRARKKIREQFMEMTRYERF